MNRNKLKTFAPQARRDFIQAVTDRAGYYGLTANKAESVTVTGDVAKIGGRPFPKSVAEQRKALDERVAKLGFEQVMEAVGYTWFNRLVAIRFMELHGYLDHGYRVLSHPEGKPTPEIVEHAEHVELPGLDKQQVIDLKLVGNKEEELYRILLIAQCNALHDAMPFLFERINDETELLLPTNLLHSDSLIRKLVNEIEETDWQKVEIIGWLYQFYISDKKDEVIGKVVASEDIPAATQLFTPNWIVKYLVQNTLGRQWLATYPQSSLRQQMDYYIEPAEQTPEVQEQLKAITPASLNPEELTLLDPACGSGHILVEAYDLFKAIYQERGYRAKDIPALILQKNLFGLEIDERAAQLASFALMMKARADDRRIFDSEAKPNISAFQDCKGLNAADISHALNEPALNVGEGSVSQGDIASLLELFENAKTFGSLIQIPPNLAANLPEIEKRLDDVLKHGDLTHASAHVLKPFLQQARLLARKYDAVVANPPYLGGKYFTSILTAFIEAEYSISGANLFSAFIDACDRLTKASGKTALITLHNWMFLADFTEYRQSLLASKCFDSIIHLGAKAFPEISGEMVQAVAFAFGKHANQDTITACYRLVTGDTEQKRQVLIAGRCRHDCNLHTRFNSVEGSPCLYWFSDRAMAVFTQGTPFGAIAKARAGLSTGDNPLFQRYWFEVDSRSIGFGYRNTTETQDGKHRWFPCNSSGDTVKWYGNQLVVVDWQFDGQRIKGFVDSRGKLRSRPQNTSCYFQEGLTWNKLGSSGFCGRFKEAGFIFDDTSRSAFPRTEEDTLACLGVLNSTVGLMLMTALNPSMSFTNWDIQRVPVVTQQQVISGVREMVELAKHSWNARDLSWNFARSPWLVSNLPTLIESVAKWEVAKESAIERIRHLEQTNNDLLVSQYGLDGDIGTQVQKSDVTLYVGTQCDELKNLLSYAIGCMMGRYSLDKPGLIYAHSGNKDFDSSQYKTFRADDDGIVPIFDTDWGIQDDAANRIVDFIGVAWPKEHQEENLKFIADSLGPTSGEQPRDTIRRYLATGFYKHHLSTYKKRPIYWLFSSGKQRAFQCLVYLHRYNEGTLSRMRTEYLVPLQGKITSRIDQLAGDIAAATSTAHRKKLEKERDTLTKQRAELQAYDEKLRHLADQRISLDLDDGVKVNYGKFGDLLAEVKAVTGGSGDE